jgi:hypothetical protein
LPSIVEAAERLGKRLTARLRVSAAVADQMLRMFAGEFHAVLFRVAAYGCALAAVGLMGMEFAMPRGSAVAEAVPDTEWVEIGKPFPPFALTLPEFDVTARFASWRHANGGGRKDIFTFGDLGSAGATAVIELYRAGTEPDPDESDITASVSELRLSGKPAVPNTIDTKFGPVTVEAFTDPAPGGARRCLRFFRSYDEPRFELSGWFCNAGEELVDRGAIGCALDRLTLVSAGSAPKLGALFARAELRRTFCGQNSVFVAATPKRNDWIEAGRDPRLRGRN